MELLKPAVKTLVYKDVSFIVRTRATMEDTFALKKAEALYREEDPLRFGLEAVKVFLYDWKGVTIEGHDVPYAWHFLMTRFPAEESESLIPQLCKFVAENVDILKPKAKE